MQLEGRSAIVTGGAGGLGAATARHLHGLGVAVVIFDLAADRGSEVAEALGHRAEGVAGDVNDDAAVADAIAVAESLGSLSIVVNVAGGAAVAGRLVDRGGVPHDKDGFIDTMAMNAFGTFNVTRLAVAAMAGHDADADNQRGVVINTGSIAGIEGQTGQLAYAAAKSAILGMTLPMARDLAPLGIRVCAIAPGTMGTPMMEMAPDSMKAALVASIVNPKRMGRPTEFALLVEAIVRNDYLNGENIRLDGALRFPPK
jgi:NAD(P)-dependent dehydrogenase (short-subunit alcohol dehydrogenase family)